MLASVRRKGTETIPSRLSPLCGSMTGLGASPGHGNVNEDGDPAELRPPSDFREGSVRHRPPHRGRCCWAESPRCSFPTEFPDLTSWGTRPQPGCLNKVHSCVFNMTSNAQSEGTAPKPKTGRCCFLVLLLREGK